ncbi:hypothetical protein FC697_23620, partial [Bacillus wiedmannii]
MNSKKFISAGLAFGILFGYSLVTPEHKVSAADASTGGTVIQAFEGVYDKFLKEPFSNWLFEQAAKYDYDPENENIAYKAPNFKKGEFAISVFDFYKNQKQK